MTQSTIYVVTMALDGRCGLLAFTTTSFLIKRENKLMALNYFM